MLKTICVRLNDSVLTTITIKIRFTEFEIKNYYYKLAYVIINISLVKKRKKFEF